MKGSRSQKLTHVRACGAHVHRMERCTSRLLRHCGIQRRTRRRRPLRFLELTLSNFFSSHITLRRSRGAMGRYQGTSGAAWPWAAAGRVRRPRGRASKSPVEGKGLKLRYSLIRQKSAVSVSYTGLRLHLQLNTAVRRTPDKTVLAHSPMRDADDQCSQLTVHVSVTASCASSHPSY